MEKIMNIEEVSKFDGHLDIIKHTLSIADFMVLKCAVDLQLPDIIHSNGQPMTLSQIAHHISSPNQSINQAYLERVMRMLVRLKIFTHQETKEDGGESVVSYGTTPSTIALLSDSDLSLAPFLLLQHNLLVLYSWHHLSDCVREGGSGFKKAHGPELFELASTNLEFNKAFNTAMKCFTKVYAKSIFSVYRDGFNSVGSVVDVGGGVGNLIWEIVNEFSHIKGFNFDLSHVVAMGMEHDNLSHVAGDMFNDDIPHADFVFFKHVLHNWGDEECNKLLKNSRKSINEKGKVVIIDVVVREEGEESGEWKLGNVDAHMDLLMMVFLPSGKERTKKEWKKIIEGAGFKRCNFIQLPFLSTLIELYP